MPKRNRILKGSTVLFVAVATGCATPTPLSSAAGAQDAAQRATGGSLIANNAGGLISNNAGGLISNNAGGLVSNNAGGLISNNAGGLISNNAGGLISNNAGGLISNNAGGLISNNAGGLTGVVRGPAAGLISNNAGGLISNNAGGLISNNAGGLISNNAGGLISNNAGGLVSNNAGGLISNNAGGYALLQAAGDDAEKTEDLTSPVGDCKVGVFNERNEMVSYSWTQTDADGNYIFTALKPSGPLLFVKAVYTREGQQIVLVSTAAAPRKAGLVNCTVTPATTIVAKKCSEMIRLRAVNAFSIRPSTTARMAAALAPTMTARAVVAAAMFTNDRAADTFDNIIEEAPPALLNLIKSVAASANAAAVIAATPANQLPEPAANEAAPPFQPEDSGVDTGLGQPASGGETGGDAGGSPSIDLPPAASNTGGGSTGGGSTGGGTSTTTDPGTPAAPAAAEPVQSATKGTSTTLGKAKSAARIEADGSGNLFAPNSGGYQSASANSTAKDSIAFSDTDGSLTATCFANGQRYSLSGGTITFGSQTVEMAGIDPGLTTDIAVKGNFAYVASAGQNCIFKVDLTAGTTDIFAGEPVGNGGMAEGDGSNARFNQPKAIVAGADALYVADTFNRRIRKITYTGTVSTLAGATFGFRDGSAAVAAFLSPTDLAIDGGNLYVTDQGAHSVRKVLTADGTTSTVVGNRQLGSVDGVGDAIKLSYPASVTLTKIGGVDAMLIAESNGNIRCVTGW